MAPGQRIADIISVNVRQSSCLLKAAAYYCTVRASQNGGLPLAGHSGIAEYLPSAHYTPRLLMLR